MNSNQPQNAAPFWRCKPICQGHGCIHCFICNPMNSLSWFPLILSPTLMPRLLRAYYIYCIFTNELLYIYFSRYILIRTSNTLAEAGLPFDQASLALFFPPLLLPSGHLPSNWLSVAHLVCQSVGLSICLSAEIKTDAPFIGSGLQVAILKSFRVG